VLEQSVAAHATRLGEKRRRDGLAVSAVTVFSHTRGHGRGDPMRSPRFTTRLSEMPMVSATAQ
jgi:DNA polymerase V